jgi:hypothetical protein
MTMPIQGNPTMHQTGVSGAEESNALNDAYDRLRRQLEDNPYQTLALVAGAGFILGGGLFTRFAVNVIAASLRVGVAAAFAPLVDSLLAQVREPLEPGNGRDTTDT